MAKAHLFNKYPAIIHGEAGGENDEFVIHTRYPRFLARRSFDDDYTATAPAKISGEIGQTQNGHLAYNSKIGLWLSDFIFFDSRPDDQTDFMERLQTACNLIAHDTILLDADTELDFYDL